MKKGILTLKRPSNSAFKDAENGVMIIKGISQFDIGQAICMQEGVVLGVEAIEGTDALIERCGELKYKSKNQPVLIKCAKHDQTLKIDMPTIGVSTIKILAKNGFDGVFIEENSSLFLEREESIKFANENNIFIVGV